MKLLYVVDRSEEDAQGEPLPSVLDRFQVRADGSLEPAPDPDSYPDVATEADLRRHVANSSFLSVEDALPPGAMEPRGSIG